MKEKFKEIIERLGWHHRFVKNFDDVNYGYDCNPTPTSLLRIKIDMHREHWLRIECYLIQTYDDVLYSKVICSGDPVRDSEGDVNWPFYEALLSNWNQFIR